jgi:hypothetical protein
MYMEVTLVWTHVGHGLLALTTLPNVSIQDDVLHLRQFWLNVIRVHNTKTRTSIYQEGTALEDVNGV